MNIKGIYDQATLGTIQIDKKGNPLIAEKSLLDIAKQVELEQYLTWLQHPETIRFLGKLDIDAWNLLNDLTYRAATATESEMRVAVVKYQTIKEVLDYARRSNDSSPSRGNTIASASGLYNPNVTDGTPT